MSLALEGIKVLDFTRYVAGPSCAQLLGDLGADVIKIEGLPGGDPTHESGPFHEGQSTFYLSVNRNKRDLALNLKQPKAREILIKMAANADIIIENFRPGALKGMGLDYEELKKTNPRLIYCSITGYGSSGPGRDLPGFDQVAQGLSGLMSITGSPEAGPIRVGLPIGDICAGLYASIGILGALVQRNTTDQGQLVETSLLQALVSMMVYQGQKYLSLGIVAKGQGNDHPMNFPHGTFKTADNPINIASGNDKMWLVLSELVGRPEMAEDPRYRTNAGRMEHKEELREKLEEVLVTRPSSEWIQEINRAGIPCGPILNLDQVYNHPQVQHLGLVQEVEHPVIGALKLAGMGVNLADSPGTIRKPPPLLGQHSAEILREAGLSEAEIGQLFAEGIARESNEAVPSQFL